MLFLYNPRSFTTSLRNLDLVVDPLGVLQCDVQYLNLAAVGFDLPSLDAADVPEHWERRLQRFRLDLDMGGLDG